MKEDKKYYKLLDIIRVVSCIGVLLYHLGYLQGGFLSVCSFFVLSGYLSYLSLSRKDKVNFKEYYKKRFKHIYLPLLIVVFITTCITAFMGDIHWFQLKPESTSVLFGYNNYWQLSVNADYFARHVSSPFMHFWYIAILLQFEIIFPFIYLFIKKTKEKIHKVFPIIILSILIIASSGYFIYICLNNNIMLSYYDTLARSFSLFIGILLGYIHKEYKSLYFKKFSNIIFYLYLVIFIVLQFIINSNNTYYWLVMIIVSLLTCRLIDYGTSNDSSNLNFWERETKFLADTSYEIYLVQYPIIFFFQYTDLDIAWKMPIMILLIFGFAYFIHFTLDFKNTKGQYLRLVFGIIIAIFSAFGLVEYVHAKDYTEEMNKLRDQLSENQKMIQDKQKDYEERLKQEQEEWNKVMNDLDSGEAGLESYVANLPIVAVGDSVMLGAVPSLYQKFPNGYFDAAVSRTDYEANRILQGVKNNGMLSDNVVIHLGTNGQCGLACQKEIMNTCAGKNVFYVTVSNEAEVHVNGSFYNLAKMYPNVHIIDWYGASQGHGEYFAADGIHLNGFGMNAYVNTIYNGIYNYYHKQLEDKKNKLIEEHNKVLDQKIYFYGNDLLLNIYDDLVDVYPESGFTIKQNYSYQDIIKDIKNDIKDKKIAKRIVISLDQKELVSKEQYQAIIDISKDYELYFVYVYNTPYEFNLENVHTISYKANSKSFMVDGLHLSKQGNKELLEVIKKGLEN